MPYSFYIHNLGPALVIFKLSSHSYIVLICFVSLFFLFFTSSRGRGRLFNHFCLLFICPLLADSSFMSLGFSFVLYVWWIGKNVYAVLASDVLGKEGKGRRAMLG